MTRLDKPVTNCQSLRTTSAINGRCYRQGTTVLPALAGPTSEIGRNHVEDHFAGTGKMIVTAPQSQIKKEGGQLATNCSQLKMTSADGKKYLADDITKAWSARDLQNMLGYGQWRRFEDDIKRAKTSCEAAGNQADYQFADAGKAIHAASENPPSLLVQAPGLPVSRHGIIKHKLN